MADTQLLPCPWCGETPDVSTDASFRLTDGVKYGALQCCVVGPEVRTDYKDVPHWRDRAIAAWNDRKALASRPAEVDDMMPVIEPVAWRHTLDEGSYFANGRNYQLLDDWDAAFADWMLHGGVLESLYSGPDTHELKKAEQ